MAVLEKDLMYTLPTGERVTALPTGTKFHRDNSRKRLIMGPFGSGKSSIMCQEIFRKASRQRPGSDGIRKTRWVVIRNTYSQLKDTTIKTWLDWFPEDKYGRFYHAPPPEHRMRWQVEDKVGGVTSVEADVLFRALDRPDQIRNLLSLELTGAWINEMREIPKAIFDAVDWRIGRYPAIKDGGCSWAGIIGDTNPYDIDHWVYKLFEEQHLPGHVFFHQTGEENKKNLQKDYYDNISIGKDPEWVKMYVKGQHGFISDGLPVYPEFMHHLHVAEGRLTAIPNIPVSVGIDFGLTPAMVWTQVAPSGQWLVLKEEIADSMGIDRFGDKCIESQNLFFPYHKQSDFRYYADPAGTQRAQTDEKTCFEILATKGVICEPGAVDFTSRREAVARKLTTISAGKPALLIDSQMCRTILKGFMGGYYYPEIGGTGRYRESPEKNSYSHPHDALQYVASRLFTFRARLRNSKSRYARPSGFTV